jgi:hypothetical protein
MKVSLPFSRANLHGLLFPPFLMQSRPFLLLLIAVLALGYPAIAVSVPLGDALDLSGSAPGADTVYLFLTGPNLPPNGVRLDNIAVAVITGIPSTFVRVPVFGDDSWEYSWNTRTAGGVLDAGTYTVYVVTTPTGRQDLTGRDSYGVISVTLTRPILTILPSGGLTITSDPAGAGVLVDGEMKGTTPLELTNMSPGNHTLGIVRDGYLPVSEGIAIKGNETITMGRTLEPLNTTASTVPETFPQPTSIGYPVAGLFLGLGIALLKRRLW